MYLSSLMSSPHTNSVTGNLVDIPNRHIYRATIWIEDGQIKRIEASSEPVNPSLPYIMPGFIDSHVHIESSMLVPSEFARLAVLHGTIGTISDPHEIANVCGVAGVEFMIENGKQTRLIFSLVRQVVYLLPFLKLLVPKSMKKKLTIY